MPYATIMQTNYNQSSKELERVQLLHIIRHQHPINERITRVWRIHKNILRF